MGTRDLRALWSPPVSLNLVHVLVFLRNFYLFYFLFFICFLLLLLFCIIKIKCFFFTFIFLFIWMQVWSLEKEDTPNSFFFEQVRTGMGGFSWNYTKLRPLLHYCLLLTGFCPFCFQCALLVPLVISTPQVYNEVLVPVLNGDKPLWR